MLLRQISGEIDGGDAIERRRRDLHELLMIGVERLIETLGALASLERVLTNRCAMQASTRGWRQAGALCRRTIGGRRAARSEMGDGGKFK